MSIRYGERERRARIGITGFDWVNDTTPHKMVLRNEKDLKAEEEERNNKKFAEIAAKDAANAAKRKQRETVVQVAAVETCEFVKTDIAIDDANRRRQKSRPEGYRHPLNEEVRKEWRLKSQIEKADGEGKYKTRPGLTWKEKAAARPAWKRALEWFKMTPQEQAAAEAEIENKMNLEDGLVGQTLAKQAEWELLEEDGWPARSDADGWEWIDKKK